LAVVALLTAVCLLLPSFGGVLAARVTLSPTVTNNPPAIAAIAGSGPRTDALLVHLRAGKTGKDLNASLSVAGGQAIGRIDQLATVMVAPTVGHSRSAVRASLAMSSAVASIEEDHVGRLTLDPNDKLWYEQWASRKVRAPNAWNTTTGSGGPIIAVLDSGIASSHVDLTGRVMAGWDFVNKDANPWDDLGHGTMVAGTAAGKGNNSVGIAGGCWGCRILPVKVANRRGSVSWSNAAAGMVWATDRGARVITMSFGDTKGNSTLQSAVQYARNHGVVVIASAGNNGNTTRFYPAAYSGVISVAATDKRDHLYDWSTRGAWVRLAAPGCVWTTKRSGGWGSFCGTSASAPLVAGIAGLALAAKPRATRDEVERAILSTAIHFTSKIGGGRLDALGVVSTLAPPPTPTPTPKPSPSPTPSASPSADPTPTDSPPPVPTETPSLVPTDTPEPTPSATP
jgi:subtilisin family serine protease